MIEIAVQTCTEFPVTCSKVTVKGQVFYSTNEYELVLLALERLGVATMRKEPDAPLMNIYQFDTTKGTKS